ncbi:MAG TPA: pyroglutamyl-peptidase I, partial [Candidatus Bathyarchaeota archaeon]|nr:pyroglutamyl-peptidase I [Candidatus Bathyarchaeota archaeon]
MKTILLTGFEPFGGSNINPSIESCKPHNGKKFNDCIFKVVEIPLRYDKIKPALIKAIEETNPSAIVCTGQSGSGEIRLERVAINIADARIPYNCGTQPVDKTIAPDGPVAYFSTLPLRKLLDELLEAKIPSVISNTAGTFGCNHIFYELMYYRAEKELDIPAGFVHVPSLPEQVIGQTRPSMALSLIT